VYQYAFVVRELLLGVYGQHTSYADHLRFIGNLVDDLPFVITELFLLDAFILSQ